MEFPALNLLFAPCFAFGPYWGRVLAMLGLLTIVYALIWIAVRVWRDFKGVRSFSFWFIACATFSSGWTGKFIPDLISVLLVLIAVVFKNTGKRPLASSLLATLGLLMKPTSIVVFGLLLIPIGAPRKNLRGKILWCVLPTLIAVLYYTLGLAWIRQFEDLPGLFATDFHPPLQSLVAFFSDYKDWFNMLQYRSFFALGFPLVVGACIYALIKKSAHSKTLLALWGIGLLQYITIAALDGAHAFMHDYYFMGLAPTSALILGVLFSEVAPFVGAASDFMRGFFLVCILIPTIELSTMDLRTLYKAEYASDLHHPSSCFALKSRHPEIPWNQGAAFRSPREEYPAIGLCFGERENSATSPYGFFWKTDPLPSACHVIDTESDLVLVQC
jgi:hypothetical protein